MRVLAQGKTKVTILPTAPKDILNPTVTELNAGLDASCAIVSNSFKGGAKASKKVEATALCDENASEALGPSDHELSTEIWRYFTDETGAIDPEADKVFQAVKTKGTTVWVYIRRTAKKATEDWAADDEISMGGEFVTDTPQADSKQDGYISYQVDYLPQRVRDFFKVAAAG